MRAFARTLTVVIAATLVAGCGSLDNDPLRTGIIRGRAVEAPISSTSLALVRERTQLRTSLGEDGAFELREVPAGKVSLYVVASTNAAALLEVEVPGGRVVDVGDIRLGAAATLTVQVSVEGGLSAAGAVVSVPGTPFEAVPLDANEQAVLAPLPAGCYEVEVSIPNMGAEDEHVCVAAGENRLLLLEVGTEAGAECAEYGCSDGLVCASDGRCVECQSTADCAAGLQCQSNLCVGQLPACGECTEDYHCGVSGQCTSEGDGQKVCLYPCVNGACPERGFTCSPDNWCVPSPSSFQGCAGMSQMDAPCSSDETCRTNGLVNGVCVESTCTLSCSSDAQCPVDYVCGVRGGQSVCVRG